MTTAALDKLLAGYEKDMLSITRLSCVAISAKTVTYTPVDTSAARKSWTPSINRARAKNREGNDAGHNITSVINSLEIGDSYFFSNGQPYITWLENMSMTRNGKTIINRGQPGHMLTRAKAEWSQTVDRVSRKVSRGS